MRLNRDAITVAKSVVPETSFLPVLMSTFIFTDLGYAVSPTKLEVP